MEIIIITITVTTKNYQNKYCLDKQLGRMVKSDDSGSRRPGFDTRENISTFFRTFDGCRDY